MARAKSIFIFVSNETAEEVNEMSDFAVHVDYDEILRGIQQLQKVDKDFQNNLTALVKALMEIGRKLKRTSSNETLEQDEAELWKTYQQLQKEILRILARALMELSKGKARLLQ
jgi:phosphate uptake regulator